MKTENEQLEAIITQEKALKFFSFDVETAVNISKHITEKLRAKHAPSYFMAVVNGNILYAECLPGASLDNANWAKRKGNTTILLGKSSYRATLEMRIKGKDLSNRGVAVSEYAISGGAFPITVGNLIIGYFGTSGTTQEEEHQIIADTIAEYQGKTIPSIFE